MDFRQWGSSSCVVLANVWSCASATAVEDDVIIDGEKRYQKPDQIQPQIGFRDRPVVDDRGRALFDDKGKMLVVRREMVLNAGRVVSVKNIEFDTELFGQDNSPQKLKSRLNDELQASINEIDLVCELTPAQRKKLEMIGRADAKKMFDQVEELRSKCRDHSLRGQEVLIFRKRLFGSVLGKGSFYQRSLPTVLTEEQFNKYSAKHSDAFRVPDPDQDFQ